MTTRSYHKQRYHKHPQTPTNTRLSISCFSIPPCLLIGES